MGDPTLRDRLVELRDRLHGEIENDHEPGCPCMCGKAANPAVLAALSKEYRAVLAEIEGLPGVEVVSASEERRARVIQLRADRSAVAS